MNVTQERSKSIFLSAAEIASPDERRAFIEAECGGDDSLRSEVDELLRHQQSMGSFLEHPAVADVNPPPHFGEGLGEGSATIAQPPIAERPGTVIGPYKLLQQIGEGGMGVVFMAEQTEPIQRTVALKIIKPGMDTRQGNNDLTRPARLPDAELALERLDRFQRVVILTLGVTLNERLSPEQFNSVHTRYNCGTESAAKVGRVNPTT